MVGASKILTVSYGTFSCTLEGFDEPFNTMKAIAEYFRDLAAEDRYFGAEPPTPDAAMLHQIAEREMKRRVEAKIQDNGVHLRATDSDAPALMPGKPKPATMFEEQPETAPADQVISDSVAEKLARIRSAMLETRATGEATRPPSSLAPANLAPPTLKAALAEAEAAEKAEAEAMSKAEAEAAEIAAAQAFAEAKAERAAAIAKEEVEKAAAEARAKAEVEAAEIAAALAKAEAEAAEDEARAKAEVEAAEIAVALAKAEAEKAEAEARATAEVEAAEIAAALAKAEAEKAEAEARAQAEAEAIADAEARAKALAEDEMLVALAGSFEDEDTPASARFDDNFDINVSPFSDDTAEGDDSLMTSLAAAMAEPVAQPAAAEAEPLILDLEDDLEIEPETGLADDLDAEFDDISPLKDDETAAEAPETATVEAATEAEAPAPEVNPTLQRARARVIKIRRATAAPVIDVTDPTKDASALSPEAEADLMRELDGVQADTPAQPAPSPERTGVRMVTPVRPQRPMSQRSRAEELIAPEDDASVKRLLEQTNTALEVPENRRRLSAISHLKAAVAATVADRKSGGDTGPTEEMRMNPYRNDLERAVRARPATSAQPNVERASPLMLVSEQRIDTPRAQPVGMPNHLTSVRPRRVSGDALAINIDDLDEDDLELDALDASEQRNIFGAATSFADYAERLGAVSLPELLEAAAAYAAHVEGQPDVSRPQMLGHVMSVQPELEQDREAMLRSFGALLREGRIEKVRRGHFMLSEASPLHAEARKAADD